MVKLRLRRKGRKKAAFYDIVAVDGRTRRDGAFIERIGYFNPLTSPSTINIDHSRALYWLNNGAQPTDVVNALLSYDGVLLRRHLGFKNASPEVIEESVEKHKANAAKRYVVNKEKRTERKAKKAAAAAKSD